MESKSSTNVPRIPCDRTVFALCGWETILVDLFQDVLTLNYSQERLSRYSVEWQPDDHHFARIGNPRLYQHRYRPAQLDLWQAGDVEWFVIIRTDPPRRKHRSRRGHIFILQPLSSPMGHKGNRALLLRQTNRCEEVGFSRRDCGLTE